MCWSLVCLISVVIGVIFLLNKAVCGIRYSRLHSGQAVVQNDVQCSQVQAEDWLTLNIPKFNFTAKAIPTTRFFGVKLWLLAYRFCKTLPNLKGRGVCCVVFRLKLVVPGSFKIQLICAPVLEPQTPHETKKKNRRRPSTLSSSFGYVT